MAENPSYTKYFTLGSRIGISIPLAGGKFFNEWGTIWSFEEEDLIEFQLSRDLLPTEVVVELGTILELKTEANGVRYSSRGIVVATNGPSRYFIRIIGEVILDEIREYYRLDVFLPMTYRALPGLSAEEAETQWRERREQRLREKLENSMRPAEPLSAGDVHPTAANISGGGVRIRIPDEFKVDDLLDLQFFVPSSQTSKETVIDIIGQVVYVNGSGNVEGRTQMFATAIRFLYIDERDRDQVIKFISWEQLQRIRQLRERYYPKDEEETPPSKSRKVIKTLFLLLVAGVVGGFLIDALIDYHAHHEKSEIHKIFEQGLREYMKKHKPYF